MKGYIYKISKIDDDKISYIGSTISNINYRWKKHLDIDNNYCAIGKYLIQYGTDKFKIELVKQYEVYDEKHLRGYEQLWINKYKLINCCINKKDAVNYLNKEKRKDWLEKNKEKNKIYWRKYRENNKEKVKEINQKWYDNNKENLKQYREDNKEKIIENSKKWYENNKDDKKKNSKKYYENNKDKFKQYREDNKDKLKKWREDNTDKLQENSKKYYENNKDKVKQYYQDNKEKGIENAKKYYEKNKEKLKEKINCSICNILVNRGNILRHQKTNKCKKIQNIILLQSIARTYIEKKKIY